MKQLDRRLTRLEAKLLQEAVDGPTIAEWREWFDGGRVGTLPGLSEEAEARQRLTWAQCEETLSYFEDEEDSP